MPRIPHTSTRMRASGAVDTPKKPRLWDVGLRIGAAILRYRNAPEPPDRGDAAEGTHASPRPHIRRGHWPHFWRGSRTGRRELVLHWLPPIPVNAMLDDDETPLVLHRVADGDE